MAVRRIVLETEELLRKVSRPVEKFDERLWTLLDDMLETMQQANGVGLAAPQVGILRRAVIIDVGEGLYEMINPRIVWTSEDTQEDAEGCLSSVQKVILQILQTFQITRLVIVIHMRLVIAVDDTCPNSK